MAWPGPCGAMVRRRSSDLTCFTATTVERQRPRKSVSITVQKGYALCCCAKASTERHMKAIVYHNYGSPDVLKCVEIEKPTAGNNEVGVRVRAASVNPLDWHFMRGSPYLVRLMAGLRKPKIPRLGVDVAGEVEAVGGNVTQFKPGDEVFGGCRGAFAEYACAAERALVMKPDNLTFEEAASVNIAAVTALQALRDHGRIQSGQKVLINGAAGGVGGTPCPFTFSGSSCIGIKSCFRIILYWTILDSIVATQVCYS